MTDICVVDASVLVEVVIDGRYRAGADALLDRLAEPTGLTLVSAAHGVVEAISALRRLVLAGALPAESGATASAWLAALDLVLDAPAPRAARIWQLRETMTAYDAAYAACAEALDQPLLSTDERLLRACDAAAIPARHLESETDHRRTGTTIPRDVRAHVDLTQSVQLAEDLDDAGAD